jgi:hypothetical protein
MATPYWEREFLLASWEKISVDLPAHLSPEERKAIVERFIWTRKGEFAYSRERAREHEPYFLLLVRNDLNRFYNKHYRLEGEMAVELSQDAVLELAGGLALNTLDRLAGFWKSRWPDADMRSQAYLDAIGEGGQELRKVLGVYRVFAESGQCAVPFLSYFSQNYEWKLRDLRRGEIKWWRIGGQEIVPVEPDERSGELKPDVPDRITLRRVFADLSRRPQFREWRGVLRWLAWFGEERNPVLETYFMLVTGVERSAKVRAAASPGPLLDEVRLPQLIGCVLRRRAQITGKDGKFEAFLVEEARALRLAVSPHEVPQLLREYDRFCAHRVRDLARQIMSTLKSGNDAPGALFEQAVTDLIERIGAHAGALATLQHPYQFISDEVGLTATDVAALDHFRRARGRIYNRRRKFWKSFQRPLAEALGFDVEECRRRKAS